LENLVDLALDEGVDFVLLAGDIFDGDWKDYNTGLYFVSLLSRLSEAGIAVFITAGNHDAAGRMTRSLPYPPDVHVFSSRNPETRVIESLKVAVHGQSFAAEAVTENLAREYPDASAGHFNIGLLHTSLTGRAGHHNYAPCTLDDLGGRGYDYWALGHVHQFEVVSRDPPVVFAGCIQGRHIRETGPKGCVLVTVQDGEDPKIAHCPLDVIRWERAVVDLDEASSVEEALERFRGVAEVLIDSHDPLPVILRVTFGGVSAVHATLAADPEHLRQSVRAVAMAAFGDLAWVEKVEIATVPASRSGPETGPFKELDAFVAGLLDEESALADLGEALSGLMQKLPQEYRHVPEALRTDDAAQMRALVVQAHALLVQRLKKEAGAP
jgi:DNA repair exonuclease SbcCD nuclease subunit